MTRHRSFEEKIRIIEYYLKHGSQQDTQKNLM